MSSVRTSHAAPRLFPPTRWSLVLAATRKDAPGSAEALETICRAYWQPLYAYVRRCGQAPPDAQDLTQEFFCRLLEKRWLEAANPDKGKLRTFLLVALKSFMANEWRRASAQRRGGGRKPAPIDTAFAESRADPATVLSPEEMFDQQWALTLLDLTVHRLQDEYVAAGKSEAFAALKNSLMAGHGGVAYDAIAVHLQMSEGAARVAVHRLRKRFREIFREEIAQTLGEGEDPEGEMRHLAVALDRQ